MSDDMREEIELPELPVSVLMRMRNNNNSGHYKESKVLAFPKPKDSQVFPKNSAEKIAIREAVFERDGRKCVDCGARVLLGRGHWNSMHLMHLKSKGSGGDWSMENLATGCLYCHAKRHNAGGKPVPSKSRR